MENNKLYFLDVSNGNLYELSRRKQKDFLSKHPLWWELNSGDDEILNVKNYFKVNGKLLSSYHQRNLLASYV